MSIEPPTPLVSILIPCYNCEGYIEECILSACNQSYSELEILVCDDGSTDKSAEKIRELASRDSRVHLFRNRANLGKVSTINNLISKSVGKYIGFLDSDDFISKDKIELQVAFLEGNPEFSFCGTAFGRVDQDGKLSDKVYPPFDDIDIRKEVLKASGMPVCCGSILAIGNYVREVGGYRTYFEDCSGEDVDFVTRLLDFGPGKNLNDVSYFYRFRPNSLTRRVFSTVKQRHSHEIIAYLSEQRWRTNKKVDNLDVNPSALEEFIDHLSLPYKDDTGLMKRKMAFDYALNNDYCNAVMYMCGGFSVKKIKQSIKCLFYVTAILVIPNRALLFLKAVFRVKNLGSSL